MNVVHQFFFPNHVSFTCLLFLTSGNRRPSVQREIQNTLSRDLTLNRHFGAVENICPMSSASTNKHSYLLWHL